MSDDFKETEIKQWCPNCYDEVSYHPRYPTYLCNSCAAKEKRDDRGNLVEFYNIGFSGGLTIIRKNKEGICIEVDETQQSCACMIDGQTFFVEEARFGGIVIQRK